MAKAKIEGLISELHERLAGDESSPQQELLLAQLQSQLDSWEGAQPADGDIKSLAEELFDEIEEKHPKAARVALEIIETMGHLGL
ncbi:MAG: hypothetical protein CMP91_02130 [Gammaproteobacteria bacterium]|nr:hypothetical protein [Gammaproteobacteria bacterium]MAY03255.1 hypothetical protein [Gammaproteobacteria bacterium]|tara:strand:- start:129 stop:383 length:255 start_codon:yes stop_codon:yes gene_type:complete